MVTIEGLPNQITNPTMKQMKLDLSLCELRAKTRLAAFSVFYCSTVGLQHRSTI
jgi:hypothetical protein